ncbi:hypothetical protein K488DRAFT_44250 [Vararia minispora EC-137]|uniref:Uncharacterized protein n=1 Tax=Vararia minispora EC-137 TaxID=1314806 RepID=A0ACB8QSX6_9AGAM|nr:hypothetical protein K488DRAFT_44250 [Vararia minispora EC-137]
MAISDNTTQFHYMVAEQLKELPSNRRRRLARPAHRVPGEPQDGPGFMHAYMAEAHSILDNIATLTRMLAAVRRPYLDVHARPPPAAVLPRTPGVEAPLDLDRVWADVRYLRDEDRDQIDLQARLVLARCKERVKVMEELEQRRAESASHTTAPLLRLLPARLHPHSSRTAPSDFIAAHNAGVTWLLTRRLAQTSETLRTLQEERVRRATERSASLGAGAAREAALMSSSVGTSSAGGGGWSSWIGAPSSPAPPPPPPEAYDSASDSDSDLAGALTSSQIQTFESENAQILRTAESTLASLAAAETRLLEIGELQAELVVQLSRQSAVTDQLYEDAMTSAEYVQRGNVQLREARRRAADGRMWILLFLIGASLSLLFLHYY